mmetsp:Transcript_2758/g.5459  ORF Transcript_2758/g.5459 Transcript_2758/m.5459 type:complete len:205 (-) Transcript_2758:1268-1882(-)
MAVGRPDLHRPRLAVYAGEAAVGRHARRIEARRVIVEGVPVSRGIDVLRRSVCQPVVGVGPHLVPLLAVTALAREDQARNRAATPFAVVLVPLDPNLGLPPRHEPHGLRHRPRVEDSVDRYGATVDPEASHDLVHGEATGDGGRHGSLGGRPGADSEDEPRVRRSVRRPDLLVLASALLAFERTDRDARPREQPHIATHVPPRG